MITKFKSARAAVVAVSLALGTLAAPLAASAEAQALHNRFAGLNQPLGLNTTWSEARDGSIADLLDDGQINGDLYQCTPGPLKQWLDAKLAEIDPLTLFLLSRVDGLNWASYYKIYLDRDASDDSLGLHGEYTQELIKRHKDARRFWNVYTDDVLLMGMHGNDVSKDELMVPLIELGFGVPEEFAIDLVDLVQALILGNEEGVDLAILVGAPPGEVIVPAPGIPGGFSNPLLTFNAFAVTVYGQDVLGNGDIVPDMIVMGDGLLQAIAALGLGINGPDTVHAHEFAHHVQFELGVFEDGPPTPAGTRRTELMADAFGAYFLHHARGAAFQTKRITDTIRTIYSNGNCDFESSGHHGTPNQRGAAAAWGAGIVDSAKNQGHIHDSSAMVAMFDAVLPILVAPDAE